MNLRQRIQRKRRNRRRYYEWLGRYWLSAEFMSRQLQKEIAAYVKWIERRNREKDTLLQKNTDSRMRQGPGGRFIVYTTESSERTSHLPVLLGRNQDTKG